MIIIKPSLKIVATILAKDEEDIIGKNIEHHIKQGISQFIVTDNRSTDKTREIVEKYPEVIEIIDEPDDTHNQSRSVTRMAKLACKLKPDWIIHLDADEFWCNLHHLRYIKQEAIASVRMYLHPPVVEEKFDLHLMRYYLDMEPIPDLPDECKVAHRPDEEVEITHGNHGFVGEKDTRFTASIWRHHYPIRSSQQFYQKSRGHLALKKRGSICKRWESWYNAPIATFYDRIVASFDRFIHSYEPRMEDLCELLSFWATEETIEHIRNKGVFPRIGEWP